MHGQVLGPLGNAIPTANVTLYQGSKQISQTTSGADGSFSLTTPGPGSYSVQVSASGFAEQTLPKVFVADTGIGQKYGCHLFAVSVPHPKSPTPSPSAAPSSTLEETNFGYRTNSSQFFRWRFPYESRRAENSQSRPHQMP